MQGKASNDERPGAVGMGWKMDRNRLRETSYRQFLRRRYVIRIDEEGNRI